jgi:ketosteroid isomerase-like protein
MDAVAEPAAVVRDYLAAMRSGDRQAAYAYFADDVVGHVPGRSALAGVRRGRDAVIEYIETVVAAARGDVEIELVDQLAGAGHVALLVVEHLAVDGRSVEIHRCNVYRVVAGRIAEIRIYEGDQYAADALHGAIDRDGGGAA